MGVSRSCQRGRTRGGRKRGRGRWPWVAEGMQKKKTGDGKGREEKTTAIVGKTLFFLQIAEEMRMGMGTENPKQQILVCESDTWL